MKFFHVNLSIVSSLPQLFVFVGLNSEMKLLDTADCWNLLNNNHFQNPSYRRNKQNLGYLKYWFLSLKLIHFWQTSPSEIYNVLYNAGRNSNNRGPCHSRRGTVPIGISYVYISKIWWEHFHTKQKSLSRWNCYCTTVLIDWLINWTG